MNLCGRITDAIHRPHCAGSKHGARMSRIPPLRSALHRRAARRLAEARSPARVGEWELVRLIGEGSLMQVFLARPANAPVNQRPAYALKMPRTEWRDDARVLECLCREARVGRRVSHPHVAPILAAGLHSSPYHVVMPYLAGAPLAAQLAGREPLAPPAALWIARQVAEGLAALDAGGWMHGDVKPSNIFVAPTGHATLIDLGFARRHDEAGSVADRPIMGTMTHIAPEVLTSRLRNDIRADIYSLGVCLYEMLTGQLPHNSEDASDLANLHRESLPADVRANVPQIPLRVARLVRQMLAKEPLRRPQTPGDLVQRLTALEIETFAERDSSLLPSSAW